LYVTYNAYEENYTTKSNEYAYITYPFSNDELLSKVTTLINYKYRPVELSDIPLPNYNESKPSDRDLMKNLNIFLFKNIKSDFFVENIAEYCQVGQSSLDKKIRRITGKNITQYVREFRLEYSIILMSRGVRSVKTLFEESGFKSEAYYSLSFKKYKGIGAKTYSRRYCF
jgi:AraC-like DNA-binding protein